MRGYAPRGGRGGQTYRPTTVFTIGESDRDDKSVSPACHPFSDGANALPTPADRSGMALTTVDLDADDTDDFRSLVREYGWWDDRERDDVARALANTDLAVGIREHGTETDAADGDLVAAARVITDFVYYARVYDVVVARDRRGDGVGRELVESVVDDDRLEDVNPVLLCREGLVPFYESVGFERYPESVAVPDDDVDGEQPLATLIHTTADR